MRVLIVKTSSLGDIIHTLPAITDAIQHIADISFDWVVEENLAEIPSWHRGVSRVIPIALRRWRKNPLGAIRSKEWQNFYKLLREVEYDYIIDAQGLVKSALITRLAKGKRCGLNYRSVWEPFATLFYQQRYAVDPIQHAVKRVRQLFANVLQYTILNTTPDYGLDHSRLFEHTEFWKENYLVFLHGTTWSTKHWPQSYWQQLLNLVQPSGIQVKLPWGNEIEYERAQTLASHHNHVSVLPKLNLKEIAKVLIKAKAIVAVDTGLGHLAAAFNIPTISLYGPTNPALTGAVGLNQEPIAAQFSCAPCLKEICHYTGKSEVKPACFSQVTPQIVWEKLQWLIRKDNVK